MGERETGVEVVYKKTSQSQQFLTKTGEFSTRINRDAHEPHIEAADTAISPETVNERARLAKRLQNRIRDVRTMQRFIKRQLTKKIDETERDRLGNDYSQNDLKIKNLYRDLYSVYAERKGASCP